MKQRQGDFN